MTKDAVKFPINTILANTSIQGANLAEGMNIWYTVHQMQTKNFFPIICVKSVEIGQ